MSIVKVIVNLHSSNRVKLRHIINGRNLTLYILYVLLRRTKGVKFDEMVPSDIPKIDMDK